MLESSKLAVLGVPTLALCAITWGIESSDSNFGAADQAAVVLDDDDDDGAVDLREAAAGAKVSLSQVIGLALAARPGSVVEAELEVEGEGADKAVFYEVTIVGDDKQLYEVKLSPSDGAIVEQSVEDDLDDLRELRGYAQVLLHTERTLGQLVDGASALVKGQAVYAGLEFDDGGPECEVLVVNGRYLVEVELEGRAGHIVELELVGMQDDDDDEHGDSDDDDDDDHEDADED